MSINYICTKIYYNIERVALWRNFDLYSKDGYRKFVQCNLKAG
jgi:hypothetical protein